MWTILFANRPRRIEPGSQPNQPRPAPDTCAGEDDVANRLADKDFKSGQEADIF